ncbi:MAG TPA: RagB/SusD family nutrient uptake outer membrane protein, partial [Chitinophagaceae bacterium]
DVVFASAKYTKEFLTDIYRRLPYGWDDNVYLDAATDDGESRPGWGWVNPVQIGAYNPTSLPDKLKRWASYYAAIRACNLFLSKIDDVPIDPEQYMNTEAIKTRMKYEALCLRAYFYTELVRFYGGVPIITKVLDQNSPELFTKRANLQEIKDFILADCDTATAHLPAREVGTDYQRVTSGIAKAIKARLLIHLASPLFNTNASVFGAGGLSPWSWGNYDANRWKEAADAAKAVVDHKDELGALVYSLVVQTQAAGYFGTGVTYPGSMKAMGWYSVFITKVNPEMMLAYAKKNLTNELEKWQLPGFMQKDGDKSYTLPTYNYAAAFENKDGVPVYQTDDYGVPLLDGNNQFIVNPLSGFDPQQPYINRDSRFYHSIWYNGSKFGGATFNTWRGEDGSYGTEFLNGYAHTGVFLRKFMDPKNISLNNGVTGQTSHNFPLYRFVEMLLDYAEATNEFLADGASRAEVILTLDKIRVRADMPGVAATFTKNGWNVNDQKQMRKFIQNERRIELAFEEHRYFDIRRWLIGEKTQRIVYEHDVLKKLNGTFQYSIKIWERRYFETKNYLLPIPQSEINNNANMQQNPGW